MAKTKEQIAAYNKEYFARPEVKERAKARNAKYRKRRAEYKKTESGKAAEKRYRQSKACIERLKRNRLKTRYNLTPEDVLELLNQQANRCAICSKQLESYHIDHCHKSNRVRGILCSSCNLGLGMFRDDVDVLKVATKYLEDSDAKK